jgi:hypothetical protein
MLAALAAAGCVRPSVGPRTIPAARLDYNAALSRSWDEDLLLNLVRLQYRDSPLFVDVSSITASYTLNRSAALSGTASSSPEASAAVGFGFNENPIIGYSYLHGEQFAQRLLTPLTPSTLHELSQSGWSIERLMLCCVQSINGVENAIAAAGPKPDFVPDYERFQRVAALLRHLQKAGQLMAETRADGRVFLFLKEAAGADGQELRSLLSLDPRAETFEVVAARRREQPDQIALQGRSLLAVMFFLSHAVEVPLAHRQEGKVTITHDAAGREFDWTRIVGPLMRIHSGTAAPLDTAVRVAFRGHWYWIDDDDLNSKTTFVLLRLLLFLKSGERTGAPPLVTIPAR